MRVIRPHLTSDEYLDYYECSACGWVYPLPSVVKEEKSDLPDKELAGEDFEKHDCSKYPKYAKATGAIPEA